MRRLILAFSISTILVPASAIAQEAAADAEATELERLVIAAGRAERSVSTVAQSVIVLERDEIEAAMRISPNAADLVARVVPGYAPTNQTISGASETFRGRNVLIMVDGVPRNTPLRDVSRILSMIDLASVERIEVVNGASSLYGAGATGGTINFITRRGDSEKPKVTVRTAAKAFSADIADSAAPETSVTVSGKTGRVDYFFSGSGDLSRLTYDGRGNEMASDAMLGQGGGDRTGSANLFGVVGYEVDQRRFEVSADWTYARQKPDWFTDYATDPVSPDYAARYTGEPLVEDSKYVTAKYTDAAFALGGLEVKAFYNQVFKQSPFTTLSAVNSIVYYSGDPLNPTASYNQSALSSDRSGLSATVETPMDALRDGATLTWGVDYAYDRTSQQLTNGWEIISPMSQHSLAGFAQAELPVTDRLRLQGGLRYEQFWLTVDDFTRPAAVQYPATSLAYVYPAISVLGGSFDYNALTFNAGAVFDVNDQLQLTGNFSQGYTITDIGAFTRRAGVNTRAEICDAYGALASVYGCSGTPDYTISYADIAPRPQLVNTYEAGLRGDWGGIRSTFSAYVSTSDDGVNYDVAANRVSQQKERIWGVEMTGAIDLTEAVTLGGLAAYQEGKYDADQDGTIEDDEYLPNNRIPSTFKGLVYLDAIFGDGLTGRGEVEFFSGRDKTDQVLSGTALVNLAVTKAFGNGDELSFAVRNVFDTFYINPTASATRGADVPGLGRTFLAAYTKTF